MRASENFNIYIYRKATVFYTNPRRRTLLKERGDIISIVCITNLRSLISSTLS